MTNSTAMLNKLKIFAILFLRRLSSVMHCPNLCLCVFAETFRSFFAEAIWPFGYFSYCIALVSVLLKAVSSAVVPNLFSVMDPFDDLAESCGPP